jgi:hypothetical protein
MTEEERAELKQIIVEVLRNPQISWEALADRLVERLVEDQHFYYLPIKLRGEL